MYKILVAEDDRFLMKIYTDTLTRENFEVIQATNGEEVINKTKTNPPDLILLDLVMPIKDGFETLEELKLDSKTKNIPVIILTNLGQEADIKRGKDLGAIDYLVKSDLSIKEIIDKVKQYIIKAKG